MKDFVSISEFELCSLAIDALCDKMKRVTEFIGDSPEVHPDMLSLADKITRQHSELTRRYIQIMCNHEKK